MWHAVSRDRKPLRKWYLEAILPPFVAILRRWRPLLAGIHELATGDGLNPLIADDRALAADALPIEVIGILYFDIFGHSFAFMSFNSEQASAFVYWKLACVKYNSIETTQLLSSKHLL